jgi:hypothetical protein
MKQSTNKKRIFVRKEKKLKQPKLPEIIYIFIPCTTFRRILRIRLMEDSLNDGYGKEHNEAGANCG